MGHEAYRPRTQPGDSGITSDRARDKARIAYLAAWEFLYSLEQVCPEVANELRLLIEDHDALVNTPKALSHARKTQRRMVAWLGDRGLACPAMNKAAWSWGLGYASPEDGYFGEASRAAAPPALAGGAVTPDVFRKTRKQFLEQAGAAYDHFARLAKSEEFVVIAPKRELNHFGWLVKYLIQKKSWALIAEEEGRHGANEKAIATDARRTAMLIGLPLPTQRGTREGTKHTPRKNRRR